ncbi:MAG: hypothetical protein V1759_01045 [bacterium]
MLNYLQKNIVQIIFESWKGNRPVGSPSPPFRKGGNKVPQNLIVSSPSSKKNVSSKKDKVTVSQDLQNFENNIRYLGYESCGFFDKKGKPLLIKKGTRDKVAFDPMEVDPLKNKGHISIHNHPGWADNIYSSAFSRDDFGFACSMGLSEIRVVSSLVDYILKPPKELKRFSVDFANEVTNKFKAIFKITQIEEADKYRQKTGKSREDVARMTKEQRNKYDATFSYLVYDSFWKKFSEKTGVIYEKRIKREIKI